MTQKIVKQRTVEETVYGCGICAKQYHTFERAERCELQHNCNHVYPKRVSIHEVTELHFSLAARCFRCTFEETCQISTDDQGKFIEMWKIMKGEAVLNQGGMFLLGELRNNLSLKDEDILERALELYHLVVKMRSLGMYLKLHDKEHKQPSELVPFR